MNGERRGDNPERRFWPAVILADDVWDACRKLDDLANRATDVPIHVSHTRSGDCGTMAPELNGTGAADTARPLADTPGGADE